MTPQIILVRHGRSAHVHREGWVDAEGFRRWREAYEAAAIDPADVPPPALVAEARRAGMVAASDAPRALASAERLVGEGRSVVASPLLRESDLPAPPWVRGRLPLAGWALAIGAEWLRGTSARRRDPGEGFERAAAAAAWLAALAAEHGSVLAVTHGDFRRLTAARLVGLGWRPAVVRRSHRTWSAWRLEAPSP